MENLKKKNEIIFCFNFILKVLFIFRKGGGGVKILIKCLIYFENKLLGWEKIWLRGIM